MFLDRRAPPGNDADLWTFEVSRLEMSLIDASIRTALETMPDGPISTKLYGLSVLARAIEKAAGMAAAEGWIREWHMRWDAEMAEAYTVTDEVRKTQRQPYSEEAPLQLPAGTN